MKWPRRFLALLLLLALAFVLAWQLSREGIEEWVRETAERRLSPAVQGRVRVSAVDLSLLPPAVAVEGLELDDQDGGLTVSHAEVRIALLASLREAQVVLDVTAAGVQVQRRAGTSVAAEVRAREQSARPQLLALVPLRIRRIEIADVRVSLPYDKESIEFSVGRFEGSARARPALAAAEGVLRVEKVIARRAGMVIEIESADTRGELTDGHLLVRSFSVQGKQISVSGSGGERDGRVHHQVQGDVRVESLGLLGEPMTRLGGNVHVEATIDGPLTDANLDARLQWSGMSVNGREAGELEGAVQGRGEVLDAVEFHWRGLASTVDGRGSVTLSRARPFRLAVSGAVSESEPLASLIEQERFAGLRAGGDLEIQGTLAPLVLKGGGKGTLDRVGGATPVDWDVRGDYAEHETNLKLRLDQTDVNAARADVTLSEGSAIAGDVTVRVGDTARITTLLGIEEVPAVRGTLNLTGKLAGSVKHPELHATMNGKGVQLPGAVLDEFTSTVAFADQQLRVDELRALIAGGQVDAGGTIALTQEGDNDVKVSVRDVPTDTVVALTEGLSTLRLPLRGGKLSTTLTARGAWRRVILSGQASVVGFKVGEERFERVNASVDARLPRWSAVVDLLHRGDETLHGEVSGIDMTEIDASWASSEWKLARLHAASTRGLRGAVTFDGQLRGPPSGLTGSVALRGTDLTWKGRALGPLSATAEAERGTWSVQSAMLQDALRMQATVKQVKGWPFDLRATWEDAPLSSLLGVDANLRVSSSGSLRLEGLLKAPEDVSGEVRLDRVEVMDGAARLATTEPVQLLVGKRQWAIASLAFEGEGTRFQASGGGGLDGSVDVSVAGEGSLAFTEILVEAVRSARGRFSVLLDLDRSAQGEVLLQGSAALDDADLDFGSAIVATGVQGRLTLSGTEVRVDRLVGNASGGRFEVGGSLDVQHGPSLTWQVAGVSVDFPEGAESEVSGDGTLTGSWDATRLSGQVRIEKMLYDKDFELTDLMPWFKRSVSRGKSPRASARKLQLDLRVLAPGELFIDNNIARVEMSADLRVRGDTAKVELSGPIEVIEGEVLFNDNRFVLTRGVIQFRPERGVNPTLNISAEAVVSSTDTTRTVLVEITGTGEKPRVSLSSDDPGLSQTDLVTLITFGKTTAELQREGGSISTGKILSAGAGLYAGEAEERLQGLLPVDRIDIEPTFSSTTGAFEPRVALGKNFTEDLTALVGTTIGGEGRRTVEMEYRLTRRIALIGSWESETDDEAGAFGGRVKFVYPFRRLPRWSLCGDLWSGTRGDEN